MTGRGKQSAQPDDMDRAANGRDEMSDPTLLHYVQTLDKRMDRHETNCIEERKEAQRQRDRLAEKMDAGFAKIEASISKLHDRVNGVIDAGHKGTGRLLWWLLSVAGVAILLLISAVGYLITNGTPWGQ